MGGDDGGGKLSFDFLAEVEKNFQKSPNLSGKREDGHIE